MGWEFQTEPHPLHRDHYGTGTIKRLLGWVRSYGFAVLVLLAIVAATFLALRTAVPEPVPDFALQAQAIYRIEVGLGAFLGFYVVCSLLVSALNGHGMTRVGREGLHVQRIVPRGNGQET